MVGRTIGKYRVVEQIGRGGMGTVYKAIDETLERTVAIKVLNAELLDQESVERFRREAMMLAKLNHGRIGAIHELTRDGQNLLMVMEFIAGDTFEKLVERGPMPVSRAAMLCAQVLDALQYAHAAGVVHRDLKPANIILTPSGDVKVMDFGIARVQGSQHLTMSGYMVGTPAYMAPEQVRGEEVDPRMDLYSIAVVLYRLVTQRLPFSGNTTIAMINSQLNSPPTPPREFRADLPDWLLQILDRGLAKVPADRFQTAAEFRAALESGLAGRVTSSGILPIDPDATMPPMPTPASMRIPVMPSGMAPSPPSVMAPAVSPSALAAQPAAVQSPKPAAAPEATVTLRAPHLATAGILLVVLVVGVGVLAFVALRRPPAVVVPVAVEEVVPAPAAAEAAPPSASPAAPTGTPAGAVAPGGAVAPAATAPAATAPSAAVPPRPAASPRPGATTPVPNASATTPVAGRGAATQGRGATAPATTAAVAEPLPATPAPTVNAPPTRALPDAAGAPAENFGDIRTLVIDGSRSREVEALLSLEPGRLIIRSRSDGSTLRTMNYASIAAATYARARRPRGQASPGVADVPENVGGAGLFGGARHWLTLQTSNEVLIIRLEDRNVIRVLTSLEARTGVKIPRTQGA